LYGEYSTYKSWLAMDLAEAVSEGKSWLIYGSASTNVLVINSELDKQSYQDRWGAMVKGRPLTPNGRLFVETNLNLRLDAITGITDLISAITKFSIGLVILDNLYSSVGGDLNKNTDAKIFIDNCKYASSLTGVAFVVVHHSNQGTFDPTTGRIFNMKSYRMFGSSYLPNWFDTVMEVTRDESDGNYEENIQITPQKHRLCRYRPLGVQLKFNRADTKFEIRYKGKEN
jgi:RecA-family ATPase